MLLCKKVKTKLSRRSCILEKPYSFTGCSSTQFFNLLPSPNTVSETVWSKIPLTVQHLRDLQAL